jgi:SAM-dependent methyltransferase
MDFLCDKKSIYKWMEDNQHFTKNKNKFAEVFTPAPLIDELLDQLPKYIWNSLDTKWLDPCAGRGNFFILVYMRLLDGLQKQIPNLKERKTHILSNMLYMVELNKENIKILHTVFGKDINLINGDFLNHDFKNEKFNIILKNPPYQIPKTSKYTGARGSSFTLWDKFIEKSYKLLTPDGKIGAITPSNWRRPNHPLYDIIAPSLEYLHIYSKNDGKKWFHVQTRFDIYIFGNKRVEKKSLSGASPPTKIIDEDGIEHTNIIPFQWNFLPNGKYKTIKKYFNLKKQKSCKILYNSNEYNSANLSKRKTKKYKYPIVHSLTRKGIGLRYSSLKKGHFGVPKVILNFNEKQYPLNDWKGEFGMSQISFGIPIQNKKSGDCLVKTINNDDFKEIIKYTKWGSFQTDYRMFEYMKPICT